MKLKLSSVLPVFGRSSDSDPNVNSSRESLERLFGRQAIEGVKKTVRRASISIAGRVPSQLKRKFSKGDMEEADGDKSDKKTRHLHRVVRRADGRTVIKAMASSANVVTQFKLRSNSVIGDEALGALQVAEAIEANLKLEKIAKEKWLITPNNVTYRKWKLFVLLLVVWETFYTPFNWGYNPVLAPSLQIVEHLIDFYFMVDFAMMFTVARKDQQTGILLTSRKTLWWRYFKRTFWLDFLTCVPIDKFYGWSMGYTGHELNDLFIVQTFKMFRMLRVYRLYEIMEIIDEMDHTRTTWFFYSAFSQYLKVVIMIILVIVLINYGSSFWYAVAWLSEEHESDGWNVWKRREYCSVIYEDDGTAKEVLLNSASSPSLVSDTEDAYGPADQLQTPDECMDSGEGSELWQEYTNTLLASMFLLLTGENLEPVTEREKMVQIVYLMVGIFIAALLYGNVHSYVTSIMARSSQYHRKMETVYDGMERLNLPKSLQTRIFYYYEYLFKEHGTLDGSVIGFVPELSSKLQAEIYLYQRFGLVNSVPFFHNIHPKVIQEIVMKMGVEVFLPGDYIINKDDFGDCMYFIYTGQCEVIVPMSDQEKAERAKKLLEKQSAVPKRRRSSAGNIAHMLQMASTRRKDESRLDADVVEEDFEEDGISSSRRSSSALSSGGQSGPSGEIRVSNSFAHTLSRSGLGKIRGDRKEEARKRKKKTYKIVATLNAGQHFGEVALVLHSKRTASIRSKGCSELCVLTKEIYDTMASQYPKDAEIMKSIILSRYGNLAHAKKKIRESMRLMDNEEGEEKQKVNGDIEEEKERPAMVKVGSSASTVPSTPSKTSRDNSMAHKLEGPNSPTSQLKTITTKFKADMELINVAIDRIFQEEITVSETISVIQARLPGLAKDIHSEPK